MNNAGITFMERDGMPNSDKGVAETILHAHSKIELLLESIDQDWWMR